MAGIGAILKMLADGYLIRENTVSGEYRFAQNKTPAAFVRETVAKRDVQGLEDAGWIEATDVAGDFRFYEITAKGRRVAAK